MRQEAPRTRSLANELTVKPNGFWKPTFTLTDGQNSYGTLRYEGVWRPKVIVEATDQTWVISGMKWRNIKITTAQGEPLGTVSGNFWGNKITFTAIDGFTATFITQSLWKSIFSWQATDGTELVTFKARAFKQPLIYINEQAKQNQWILILAFLALEIQLTRQKHAVAAM
ncbi:hypothetical protein KHS38_20025 [Mucilaginibacter sp. Bleaf8]|uniref:hypothetical protein n=1 Tax=Mucilaginibacter sp. Bleaf8 TaxID=2834430 RepID=UPI001BCDF6C9|nr:hypothetical protein [Mucilaginibacter sp. Bleaf8]MBS7566703.1 hypothetical protein [Mucilaginibacter sp. Bleaf8]